MPRLFAHARQRARSHDPLSHARTPSAIPPLLPAHPSRPPQPLACCVLEAP